MDRPKPLALVILDGFGVSLDRIGNPVAAAKTPVFDELDRRYPFTVLQASGVAVGLPWGEAGNSEVGHLTMGAGRIIHHHLPRIISSIRDGSFFENAAFKKAIAHVRANNSRLHIAGLVSSGSVHAYSDHLIALFELTMREKIPEVYLHIFSDGKDAPPRGGAAFIAELERRIAIEWPHIRIASVVGRSFAMDRDNHWDRIKAAYQLLTSGAGEAIRSVSEYLDASYRRDASDEMIPPARVTTASGVPLATVKENDALIFFNFREDSMREITRAFVEDDFDAFERGPKISNLIVVTMTEYKKGLGALAAFPPLNISWPLARVVGEEGLRHLHIAENEKYAHVTYFFNGGVEEPFKGEERILITSVIASHPDEFPEMRAPEITAKIIENFGAFDVIIANFANADMVGHTGNFNAAARAVEALDEALGALLNTVLTHGGVMLVTGDHGNIELKRDLVTGEKLTKHSLNPVPLYLVGKDFKRAAPRSDDEIRRLKSEVGGILTDIAPTILELLNIEKPAEMTGESMLTLLKQT